jgi:hypothetical protein
MEYHNANANGFSLPTGEANDAKKRHETGAKKAHQDKTKN